ncbi:DEAD/DEAH box helicase [Parafrankia discariae]|uniref:DEAD/DEAH box helicase n=1 Tax=Parafrankia discariae TaxID=365528 RepID=UPI0003610295|nr:DEAD/DEAH box helicase [Parafrankia discariae]
MRTGAVPAENAWKLAAELLDPRLAPGYFATSAPRSGSTAVSVPDLGTPQPMTERRLLHWCKIADPWADVPSQPDGVDVRVLVPLAADFDALCALMSAAGVPHRRVRHWAEAETVSTVGPDGALAALSAVPGFLPAANTAKLRAAGVVGMAAEAARDAFELAWDNHGEPFLPAWSPVHARTVVPPDWVPYLPHPGLNPAQAEAAPHVLRDNTHLLVAAPTGSGKTAIGMLAALKAILGEGRKAAWLVPQRSLTDELDRELATWRARGLRVERLSGEHVVDVERAREADLWVSTTEKFESVCRATSLRAALGEVGCLVIDEIHLLGSAGRGPLLEALLARVRGVESPVRIVGLSATVANAEEVAGWLGARVVTTTWRPSRLTWQLPMIPATADRRTDNANRLRAATALTRMVTDDGGSVLVFCGSRRNVRATALTIAADRGADIRGIDPDDGSRVHQVCTEVGVGLHYKDWEHRHEAERAFRARGLDVLVATTTVAAGVNLPARAVVVRDTRIGLDKIDVATVQQMFGRAGRVGAGETEGWSYLVVDETERATWQNRLVEGYAVRSHIADSLADHLLAEAAQQRVHTLADAENWWLRTLAHHQGAEGLTPVRDAVDLLVEGGYVALVTEPDVGTVLRVTELGRLTTRFMVPVEIGTQLRGLLAEVDRRPHDPEDAERLLGLAIGVGVPQFAEAPVTDDLRPQVARLLRARGYLERVDAPGGALGLAPSTAVAPGDLAQVAIALVANSPRVFSRPGRRIAGLPSSVLLPILSEMPRYFAWLAAQGELATVAPWVAVIAGDLGRRIRWRQLAPTRGAGRLLWMCEQMATPLRAERIVPLLFTAARGRGVTAPDWPVGRAPAQCQLDAQEYLVLLRDRATDTTVTEADDRVKVTAPNGTTAVAWAGHQHAVIGSPAGQWTSYPGTGAPGAGTANGFGGVNGSTGYSREAHAPAPERGVSVFSRRGDHVSTGWLSSYNGIHDQAGFS